MSVIFIPIVLILIIKIIFNNDAYDSVVMALPLQDFAWFIL